MIPVLAVVAVACFILCNVPAAFRIAIRRSSADYSKVWAIIVTLGMSAHLLLTVITRASAFVQLTAIAALATYLPVLLLVFIFHGQEDRHPLEVLSRGKNHTHR